MSEGIVLSLCDRTGVMVGPWLAAGYRCTIVDVQHTEGFATDGLLTKLGADVREIEDWMHLTDIAAVFAFPPCTHMAVSGARWFKSKGLKLAAEAFLIADACREIAETSGAPWMLENPVSTLATYWRKPDYTFDPCDFAGYAPDESLDAYTKRTCLWTGGGFVMPAPRRVDPVLGSKMHLLPPSADRADLRSVTPGGFARAVFEANHGQIKQAVNL
jgi:hypothetical protein